MGRIEHAHRGTLFFDEVESMPQALQVKLLRVLEAREIALGTNEIRSLDLRVVAAAKVDLDEAWRLPARTISSAERRHGAPAAAARAAVGHSPAVRIFRGAAAKRFGRDRPPITAAIRHRFEHHAWPGNVRELRHFAEGATLGFEDEAGTAPTPEQVVSTTESLPERVERYEADQIRQALTTCKGDVRRTLEMLGIPRETFYDKLTNHGSDRSTFTAE